MVRLYQKYELDYNSRNVGDSSKAQQIQDQFVYAEETINALDSAMKGTPNGPRRHPEFNYRELFGSIAIQFIKRALILGVCLGAIYYFT